MGHPAVLPTPLPSSRPPLLTFINDLEEDGGLVLKIILLGVLHMTGVFACVGEFQVPQQNGNIVHLLLRGTLQSDAIIIFELHLGVRLLILHRPVYELQGEGRGEEVARKNQGPQESWHHSNPFLGCLPVWVQRESAARGAPPTWFPSNTNSAACLT